VSGVQTGSRLERLYTLRRQINQEIAALELETALDGGRRRPEAPAAPVAPKQPYRDRVTVSLDSLGVTGQQVKVWAFEQGLVPELRRGRVSARLVEAYAAARDGIQVVTR
jgi:hypothetical protein